jgi:hypothetical protein
MNPAFFGQYLLSKGIIDAKQLAKALTAQEAMNKRIGALAIEKNMLDEPQVNRILELQKTEDLFFGQAAQKLGYLDQAQVDELVKTQKDAHVCLGQVLVTLGYVPKETRDKALADFILEQNKRANSVAPFAYLEVLKRERPFIEKFTANTIKLLHRMSGMFVKFDKYEPIDKTIDLEGFTAQVKHTDKKGNCVLRYILLLNKEISAIIHIKLCRRNGIKADELTADSSLSELLNIICCTSCNSCQSFASLSSSVPQIIRDESYASEGQEKAILVSLLSPYGQIRFILSFSWKK